MKTIYRKKAEKLLCHTIGCYKKDLKFIHKELPNNFEEGWHSSYILCNEIIKEIENNFDTLHSVDRIIYWNKVKIELDKIYLL